MTMIENPLARREPRTNRGSELCHVDSSARQEWFLALRLPAPSARGGYACSPGGVTGGGSVIWQVGEGTKLTDWGNRNFYRSE